MSLKEEIAIFIKERRQELDLNMEELAILIWDNPTKKSQVSNYESGKRSMSVETLELFFKSIAMRIKTKQKVTKKSHSIEWLFLS